MARPSDTSRPTCQPRHLTTVVAGGEDQADRSVRDDAARRAQRMLAQLRADR